MKLREFLDSAQALQQTPEDVRTFNVSSHFLLQVNIMSSQETGWFFTDARFYGGFAAGVVVLVALGFNWVGDFGFGWKLGSTTQQLASQAVEERLAAVCVARAQQDPEAESVLAALRKETSWKQRGFVTERGWATILPSEAPDRGVAGRCAKLLAKPSI